MKLRIAKWEAKDGNTLTSNGLIRINSNKPEYGSLMLIATAVTISNGFANTRNKVGFVTGEVTGLEAMIKEYNLREGSDFSQNVAPHRIVTLEKVESEMTDADLGYREKINPSSGEVLNVAGDPIYWKTEVVAEGSDVVETLIQHDRESVAADPALAEFAEKETGSK